MSRRPDRPNNPAQSPYAAPGSQVAGRTVVSLRNLGTFSSFGSRSYRLLYFAMLGQMASMNMEMIARSLLTYRLTGSAAILGLMALANSIPMLLFSFLGGIAADRLQKKYILIFGQVGSGLVSLGIGLTLSLGYLSADRPGSWWILVAAGALQGTVQSLILPSRQTIIADVVGQEQLMNAVALNVFGQNTLRLFAPALSGFLIDAMGFSAIYYTMAGLYAVAIALTIPLARTGTSGKRRSPLADLKDGVQYVRRETTILLILIFTLFTVILSMPYMMMLPVFTEDILHVSATKMGVLISVSGIGAMAASVFMASMPNRRRGLLMLISCLILGLALVGFSFSHWWYLSLGMIVLVGVGQSGRMTLSNTLLQYYVADDYRGRVMSFYMMDFGLTSLGVFFTGVMAETIGVQWSVGGLAIILVVLSVAALIWLPRIRKLE